MHKFYKLKSVCYDCAKREGFTLKDKVIGFWNAKCDVCGRIKPTCDLVHDYVRIIRKEEKGVKTKTAIV